MASINYSNMVSDLMSKSDEMTSAFLSTNYQTLADYMTAPIGVAGLLYVVLTGYGILFGFLDMSMKTLMRRALTIGLVSMFALNWLNYQSMFVGLFQGAADKIASLGASTTLSHVGTTINEALQNVLTNSVDFGGEIIAVATYRSWMPFFIGTAYMLCGTIIVAIAVLEEIMMHFFLTLLLATGPLFLGLALLEQTRGAFKVWLSLLASFSFGLIFLGFATGMSMQWMHWVVAGTSLSAKPDIKIHTLVPLLIVSLLSAIVLIGIIPLAKQIGGSMAGGAHGGRVAGGVLGAGRAAKSLFKKGGGRGILNFIEHRGGTHE